MRFCDVSHRFDGRELGSRSGLALNDFAVDMHLGPRAEFFALGAAGAGTGDKFDVDVAQEQRMAARNGATVVVDGATTGYVAVGHTKKVPQEATEDVIAVDGIIEEAPLNVGHAEVDVEGAAVNIDAIPAQVLAAAEFFDEAAVDEFGAHADEAQEVFCSAGKALAGRISVGDGSDDAVGVHGVCGIAAAERNPPVDIGHFFEVTEAEEAFGPKFVADPEVDYFAHFVAPVFGARVTQGDASGGGVVGITTGEPEDFGVLA